MGSEDCGAAGFFSFFSFFGFFSWSSRGASRSSRCRPRSRSSLGLSPYRSPSRSRRGDRGRSRYPRSNLRSSPRESSVRLLSFHRNPPVFLGRSLSAFSLRRGDLLRDRSPMTVEWRKDDVAWVPDKPRCNLNEAGRHVTICSCQWSKLVRDWISVFIHIESSPVKYI
jgi:hypothetical protein